MFQISSLLHQIILSTSNLRTLMSVSFHHFTVTGCCRIWNFLWRGKSRFVELGVSNLFSFAPSTSNLRASMLCQGYLFSMSTIHCAIFAVTGFCRICQSSLFSQVSALGVHLDNFVSNAMPGLLVFHVHHTFSAFTVTGFCRICQLFFVFGVYPKLENFGVCQFSSSKHDKTLQDLIFSLEG